MMQLKEIIILGIALRLLLYCCSIITPSFASHTLLFTAQHSYRYLSESAYLHSIKATATINIPSTFQTSPLLLAFFTTTEPIWPLVIFLCDICNTYLIYRIGSFAVNEYPQSSGIFKGLSPYTISSSAATLYFLNPLVIVSTLTKNADSLVYFFILLLLYASQRRMTRIATCSLAISILLHFYASALIFPIVLLLSHCEPSIPHQVATSRVAGGAHRASITLIVSIVFETIGWFVLLLWSTAYWMIGSNITSLANTGAIWSFMYGTHAVNTGIWWYFSVELFARFQSFFSFVFSALPFFYAIGITFRMRERFLLSTVLIFCITTLMKPAPSYTDVAFILPLISVYIPLFQIHGRPVHLNVVLWIFAFVMSFLMCYLWLQVGIGNANFVFFQTLIANGSLSLLIVEAIRSVRQFDAHEAIALTSAKKSA